MSVFQRIFNRFSAAHIPFREMAGDTSKPVADRGREVAIAASGQINFEQYQKFRSDQLQNIGPHITRWEKTNDIIKQVFEQDDKHSRRVKEVSMIGEEALLKHASHLQAEAASLGLQRAETVQLVKRTLDEMELFREVFSVMASAEQYISLLPEAEKKYVPQTLNALAQHADNLKRLGRNLPPENKQADIAITNARNAEIARANARREAILKAESEGSKIKFNEYLDTGFVTEAAIKAPKTARFTRKPKTASVP